jgi:acetyltransferase-like isoleucine patch superfamily enzyme
MAHSGGSPIHQRMKVIDTEPKPIIIKSGAWIGANAVILPGVTIGECAIIAAGSVVHMDVKPYTLVAGNPARFVRDLGGD